MVKTVAVIGAGASGVITAAALQAEDYFDKIKVFERRSTAGGTWNHDADPGDLPITPGALPPDIDRPLDMPSELPATTPPSSSNRYDKTPIYEGLTTNVPEVAMSFSDVPFPYGPFVPYHIPRQYLEGYLSWHQIDQLVSFGTTVERLESISGERWRLVLRKRDAVRNVDAWWEEKFDAVVVANGHYSVPFVPTVKGLAAYIDRHPGRIRHSKIYRTPKTFHGQSVLVIGSSASAYDIVHHLLGSDAVKKPVYVSRRSKASWESRAPPGIHWLPVITEYGEDDSIVFADGTILRHVDAVVYCTGYKASFPWWDASKNGRALWDYESDLLINNYQHTFVSDYPTLSFVGIARVLTFRSTEYQAVAIARRLSGRNAEPLPPLQEQQVWRERRKNARKVFHKLDWNSGETLEWFRWLYDFAGLPQLEAHGRSPPVLDGRTKWAIEHVLKYPEWKTKPDGLGAESDKQESCERNLLDGPADVLWFL